MNPRIHAEVAWADVFREAGQDAAGQAEPDYFEEAIDWVQSLASGQQFTADDLADRVGYPPSRGISGAVLAHALKDGLIRGDGYTKSRRLTNRGRVVAVWRRV